MQRRWLLQPLCSSVLHVPVPQLRCHAGVLCAAPQRPARVTLQLSLQHLAGKTFPLGARTIRAQAVMYAVQGVKNGAHDAHITVFFGDAKEHSKY